MSLPALTDPSATPIELGAGVHSHPVELPTTRRRRRAYLAPLAVVVAGGLVFGSLAAVLRAVHRDEERRLLQQQTDQAGAVLTVAIGQQRAPLDALARAAAATGADPATFVAMAEPLVGQGAPFARVLLLRPGSPMPVAAVGDGDVRARRRSGRLEAVAAAPSKGLHVVDLVDDERTIGYAVTDAATPPVVLVYAEQQLGADPRVRRRADGPFATLDYAMYLGDDERNGSLVNASVRSLPIGGLRASTAVPFGDRSILLVTTSTTGLGGGVPDALWWLVLVAGGVVTSAAAWVVTRLRRGRDRAAELAAANARLFQHERANAERLQLSLLPQRLHPPHGGRLAARYWPAGEAGLIGGDLFDAFVLDDGRWGLVIGDVCGKGVEAAGLTGLVRFTLRSASHYAGSPAEALRAVHRAMADHTPSTFCTVCFVVLRPDGRGGGDLTVALGGHLPPLLVRDGTARPIGRPGTLLGMLEPTVHDTELTVEPGDTLVLVTDGLTDARGDEAVSVDELADLLTMNAGRDVDDIADAIGRMKRSRRPDGSDDDTAVLVVRFGA